MPPAVMTFDNRISLRKLEIFCLVVDLGGVGKAAEHLFVAQPVVTAHMRSLQERIGAQLLYREGRHMRLTEAGEAVYEWSKEVLARSHEVAREIEGLADGTTGTAVVAASMTVGSYLLPPILSEFRSGREGAKVTLHISDPERAIAATEIGDCDFALVMTDARLDPRIIEAETLGTQQLVLVASPKDPQVGEVVTLDGLSALRYVCSPGGLARRRFVDRQLERAGVTEREIVIELGHPEAMKRATRDGLGVCFLFRVSVEEELAAGTLREVAVEDAVLSVPILLLWRTGKRLSPLQRALVQAIRVALTPAGVEVEPAAHV